MKLVVATPLYPPEIGGPATHTVFLERALPAHGIEVEVVPFSRVRHLPKWIRHARYAWLVFRAARRADALFAQDTVSVGFPALVAAAVARVPLLVRVPGDQAWEQGRQRFGVTDSLDDFQTKRYGWRVELIRLVARFVVRHADLVIVPSAYFKRIVGGWLGRKNHIQVIYNGVDSVGEPLLPSDAPPHPFFVSAGRLVPWKGFGALVDMLRTLPEWTLVIIGDGSLRETLEARAREAQVADRVVFTGTLPRAELLGWLAAADAFVLNSSFESFSYQVVEAMGSGVPVIAPAIGSVPELVHDGVEGALVTPDDTKRIAELLESVRADAALWKERTEAAKRAAARFSAGATAQQVADALRSLV